MAGKYNKGYYGLSGRSLGINRMLVPGSSVCGWLKMNPSVNDEPVLISGNGIRLMRHDNRIAVHQTSTMECVNWLKLENNMSEIGENGVEVGSPAYASGKFGDGFNSISSSNYVYFPYMGLNRGCIEIWYKPHFTPSNSTVYQFISSTNAAKSDVRGPILYWEDAAKKWSFAWINTGGSAFYVRSYFAGFDSAEDLVHVACVWDADGISGSSDTLRIYINGALKGSDVSDISDGNDGAYFYLGKHPTQTSRIANAVIDNVKVWNYPKTDFSDREIEDATDFIEGDNGLLLPGDDEYHHYAARINSNRTYDLFLDGVKEYSSSMKIPEECFIDWEERLKSAHHWKLDETSGTVVYDSGTVGGANGTNSNATVNQIGKLGKAYDFVPTSVSYINTGLTLDLTGSNVGGYSFWAKADALGGNKAFIMIGTIGATGSGQHGCYQNSGDATKLDIGVWGSSSLLGPSVLSTGEWFHVAVIKGDVYTKVYFNGVVISSSTATNLFVSGTVYIGTWGTTSTYVHDGLMDDVRIYNRELSAEEVHQLYHLTNNYFLPKPKLSIGEPISGRLANPYYHWPLNDRSGTNVREIVQGADGAAVSFPVLNKLGYAGGRSVRMSDGTNYGYFNCGDIDIPNICTFSAWVNPTWVSTGGSDKVIFGKSLCMYLYLFRHASYSSHFGVYFYIYSGSTPYSLGLAPPTYFLVPSGEWAHVIGVNDGANLKIYVNGQLVGQNANGQSTVDNNSNDFRIGYATVTGSIVGNLQDARIYNFAITEEEARQLYNIGHTPLAEVSDLRFDYPALTDAEISEVAQHPTDDEKDRDAEHQLEEQYPEVDINEYLKPDHHWLDQDGGLTDTGSIGGYDAVNNSATAGVLSKVGETYKLGPAGWISIDADGLFNFKDEDFTIVFWHIRYSSGTAVPLARHAIALAGDYPSFAIYNGYRLFMDSGTNSWDIANDLSFDANVLNEWKQLALVRKGNTFYQYTNGVLDRTFQSSLALEDHTSPVSIGKYDNSGTTYDGCTDDLRVYKRGLSGKEIELLHNHTKNYKRPE